LKLERLVVRCPACGQQVEAVARDGRVKGYCTVARQYVDFPIEKKHIIESKVGILSGSKQMRDSRGRFIKGNVPLNKRVS
jgi:endogenous inhibitor of DNA gyrase (YacG/DUF329 family)